MGFGQGLSGLNAAAQNLDVIGNNIANSGTVGFKAGSATFADIYANSRVGLGVQVASINQRFTTGIVSSTGNQFDMAIDGPKGFFVVQDPNGAQFYTRNGQFFADKENKIVNAQGQQIMGYAPGGTNLIGMTVPMGNIDPVATSNIANQVNLDANVAVVPDATVPETLGVVDLTQNGATTRYYYRITSGTYSWTDSTGNAAGPVPPTGAYMTDTSVDATDVTFTNGVPNVAFPTTGGNVAADDATVGILVLNDTINPPGTYYYRTDDSGAYKWYQDPAGTIEVHLGDPEYPANGTSYNSGAPVTAVTFTDGVPDVALPEGGGNALGDVGTVGSVYLNGEPTPYYYRTDDTGAYTWYEDAAGTIAVNAGEDGYPANGQQYATGAEGNATVTFASAGIPTTTFPAGIGNTAYVAPVTRIDFDPTNPDSFSDSLPITVYDSLGNEHRLTQYYTKRPAEAGNSVWEVNYRIDGLPPSAPLDGATKLTFDSAGRLISTPSSYNVSLTNPGGAASPAAPLNILVNYAGSTQFGGGFTKNFVPDGYPTGEYASTSIGANGEVIANYTNGAKKTVGTLALADFNNLQGLQSVGGNAWAETATSGQPVMGTPGSNGLATIKGQAVEESNVDMSQELVNMIIAQRTYQANAQTIKTQDQILQTLITLR